MLSYLLPLLAVAAVVFGYEQISDTKMHLCKHEYALCTSAQCVPQPGDPTQAMCFCDVKQGASMATVACNTLQPSSDVNGIRTVYSTFSFAQFAEDKKSMTCPSGTPWTWCLNKQCTVNPSDPEKALCVCDVVRTGEWTTLGGNCDTSTCTTGYWSGAGLDDFAGSNAFMVKALALKTSPAKWCQVTP